MSDKIKLVKIGQDEPEMIPPLLPENYNTLSRWLTRQVPGLWMQLRLLGQQILILKCQMQILLYNIINMGTSYFRALKRDRPYKLLLLLLLCLFPAQQLPLSRVQRSLNLDIKKR